MRERRNLVETLGPLAFLLCVLLACANNDRAIESANGRAAEKIRDIQAEAARARIYADCKEVHPPGATCGLLAEAYWDPAQLEDFVELQCDSEELDEPCWRLMRVVWYRTLLERYRTSRPIDLDCLPKACKPPRQEELEWLHAHNAAITAHAELKADTVLADRDDRIHALELEDANRRRAIGEALMRAGQSMQRPPRERDPAQPPLAGRSAASGSENDDVDGCSNDIQCGPGKKCFKDSGAFRGVCATPVNEYGNRDYGATSDPSSMGPGSGTCSFTTDCPIGFRCVKTSGGLKGNCFK